MLKAWSLLGVQDQCAELADELAREQRRGRAEAHIAADSAAQAQAATQDMAEQLELAHAELEVCRHSSPTMTVTMTVHLVGLVGALCVCRLPISKAQEIEGVGELPSAGASCQSHKGQSFVSRQGCEMCHRGLLHHHWWDRRWWMR